MKVRVYKLSENKNTYRTPIDELDFLPTKPEVGRALFIHSSTFESGGIVTSIVKEIEIIENGFIVKTENSTYKILEIKQ